MDQIAARTTAQPNPKNTEVKTPIKLSEAEFWMLVEQLEIQYGLKKFSRAPGGI